MNIKIFHIFLLLVLGIATGVRAGVLGISRDPTDEGYYHWSSVAVFAETDKDKLKEPNEITALVAEAYDEMIKDVEYQGLGQRHRPAAMAALVVDREVFFSSSLKGGSFLYAAPTGIQLHPATAKEVTLALERCQTGSVTKTNPDGSRHKYNANCGEPLAAQQYLVEYPQRDLATQNAIVVTWGNPRREPKPHIMDPCHATDNGEATSWGCEHFLAQLKIRAIRENDASPVPSIMKPVSTRKACFWGP